MAPFSVRNSRLRRLALSAAGITAVAAPGAVFAQCVATGASVACTGSAPSYTNTGTGVNVTVASGATVAAPLVIGSNGTLTNSGTITGANAVASVQYGANAAITNGGTISSTGSGSGAGAIVVGDFSTVTNNATLTSIAATSAVQFGTGGTFTIGAAAPVAVSGNIAFGSSTGANVSTFNNNNTGFGLVGSVSGVGNLTVNNGGLWTGNFTQAAAGTLNVVNFTNANGATFSGIVSTQDQTNLTNNGTMFLYQGITASQPSAIGTLYSGAVAGTTAISTLANGVGLAAGQTATLNIGTTAAPAAEAVYGNFTQGAQGVLVIAIAPPNGVATAPGVNYSQVYAHVLAGTTTGGVANLGGTLALNVGAGFYPTGSTYQVIVADQGITGNFATITGNALPFITFVPLGTVTIAGTQQAYEFQVVRTQTYAQALVNGTPNELAIARGLQPLVATATANPATDGAAFVGQIDVLTLPQAQAFLDSVSPEGYYAYGIALRDQANAFTRTVDLRLDDQNSNHDESGFWLTPYGQYQFGSATNAHTRQRMFGIAGGYDISAPHYVLGIAGNFSTDGLRYAPGTLTGHNRDLAIAAYGAYHLGPVRLSGQAAYNFGKLSAEKTIALGAYTRSAHAGTGEHAFKLTGTAGFDLKARGVLFTPFVGIDYLNGKITGFTETNAGAADLTVNGISVTRTDLLAGATITRATGHLRPYLKGVYRSQIGTGSGNLVSAYFNGDTTTGFTVVPLAEPRHEVDAKAGINWVFEDAGSLYLGYQGTYRGHFNSHGINLGIRLEF